MKPFYIVLIAIVVVVISIIIYNKYYSNNLTVPSVQTQTAPAASPDAAGYKEITSESEGNQLLQGQGPFAGEVVVMFYRDGCGPCTNTKPNFIQAASYSKKPMYLVNAPKLNKVAAAYQLVGVPSILVLKGGKRIDEYSGDRSTADIAAFANRERIVKKPFQ